MVNQLIQKIVVISVMCAFAFGVKAEVAPLHVKGVITINTEEAKVKWLNGVKFFDPRTPSDYKLGHIPKAINISRTDPSVYNRQNIEAHFAKDEPVVIYCNGPSCLKSSRTSAELIKMGYEEVYYYREGFPDWSFEGHPVE